MTTMFVGYQQPNRRVGKPSVDDFSEIIAQHRRTAQFKSTTSNHAPLGRTYFDGIDSIDSSEDQTQYRRGLSSIPRRWLRVKRMFACANRVSMISPKSSLSAGARPDSNQQPQTMPPCGRSFLTALIRLTQAKTKRSIAGGLVKFLAVGCGLNECSHARTECR